VRVLWDVDTQVDFMLPDGKLYVRGAEETMPAMGRLVAAARAAGLVHVASADDHELTDPEISDDPNFSTTYPPHCLRGTRGARKIPETEQEDPVPIGLGDFPERYLEGREYLLLKKHFDVFTNPNTERLLERLDADPLAEGDLYPGDLLVSVMELPGDYWVRHAAEAKRMVVIARRATYELDALEGSDHIPTRLRALLACASWEVKP
jgi:hypothetical protein